MGLDGPSTAMYCLRIFAYLSAKIWLHAIRTD
jgi:hypothetical protein